MLVPAFFYAFDHLGYGGDQLMQVCVATSMATIVITLIAYFGLKLRRRLG